MKKSAKKTSQGGSQKLGYGQEILKLRNKLRAKKLKLDKLKNATHSLNVFMQENKKNTVGS